jgi:hypothetical protein
VFNQLLLLQQQQQQQQQQQEHQAWGQAPLAAGSFQPRCLSE